MRVKQKKNQPFDVDMSHDEHLVTSVMTMGGGASQVTTVEPCLLSVLQAPAGSGAPSSSRRCRGLSQQ